MIKTEKSRSINTRLTVVEEIFDTYPYIFS